MKNKSPPQAPKHFEKNKARRRDNDEQISNAKPEAATEPAAGAEKSPPRRPEAFLGRFWAPPRNLGEPRLKKNTPTPGNCSRIWAGNQIFPPVTSFLFDP